MDLSHIEIVVQWKLTCDLCTLWQRFGRGARGIGTTATAILLVEKKDTEVQRQSKAEKALKKSAKGKEGVGTKRKSTCDQTDSSKRPALGDRAINLPNLDTVVRNSEDDVNSPPVRISETDAKEDRRQQYTRHSLLSIGGSTSSQTRKTKGKPRTIEIAMDDYVNAEHIGFSCRRVVPTLYFANDKARTSLFH